MLPPQRLSDRTRWTQQPANLRHWLAAHRGVNLQRRSLRSGLMPDHVNDCERAGMERIAVALEIGPKQRVFAQALDWIGWCRAGKDEVTALHQLVIAGPRYAPVAARAGLSFTIPPSFETFEVVGRVPGTATTDFGA